MRSLTILDGNCYLHAGEANFSKGFSYLGFPTSGIYHLMKKVCRLTIEHKDYAVVFDSPSFRKRIDSDYKLSRKVDNKILAQAKVIVPSLRRADVNVLQVTDFEGDDLIANLVDANKDRECIIYTCDYDIAMNVSSHAHIVGCRKDFPEINKANFKFVVSRDGREVPCNVLGMEKVIFGCDSDNIRCVGSEAQLIWLIFLKWWSKEFDSKGRMLMINETVCNWFIDRLLPTVKFKGKSISRITIEAMKQNIPLVFPRYLTDNEIKRNNINLTEYNEVDELYLMDVCRLFGLKGLYKMLNRYYTEEEKENINDWLNDGNKNSTKQLTENELKWVRTISAKYKQNGYAIEAGIPIDSEAGYHGSMGNSNYDGSPRDLDSEVSDFDDVTNGANVGTF